MAPQGSYTARLIIIDSTATALDGFNKRMKALNQPFDHLNKSLSTFSKVTGFEKIGQGLKKIETLAFSAMQTIAKLTFAIVNIGGALSIAGASAGFVRLDKWGIDVKNFSNNLDMTTTSVLNWREAMNAAGGSAEDANSLMLRMSKMKLGFATHDPTEMMLGTAIGITGDMSIEQMMRKVTDRLQILFKSRNMVGFRALQEQYGMGIGTTKFSIDPDKFLAQTKQLAEDEAKAADDFDKFGTTLNSISTKIKDSLVIAFQPLADQFKNWLDTKEGQQSIQNLVTAFGDAAKSIAVFLGDKENLKMMGDIFSGLGDAIKEIAKGMKLIGGTIGWKNLIEILLLGKVGYTALQTAITAASVAAPAIGALGRGLGWAAVRVGMPILDGLGWAASKVSKGARWFGRGLLPEDPADATATEEGETVTTGASAGGGLGGLISGLALPIMAGIATFFKFGHMGTNTGEDSDLKYNKETVDPKLLMPNGEHYFPDMGYLDKAKRLSTLRKERKEFLRLQELNRIPTIGIPTPTIPTEPPNKIPTIGIPTPTIPTEPPNKIHLGVTAHAPIQQQSYTPPAGGLAITDAAYHPNDLRSDKTDPYQMFLDMKFSLHSISDYTALSYDMLDDIDTILAVQFRPPAGSASTDSGGSSSGDLPRNGLPALRPHIAAQMPAQMPTIGGVASPLVQKFLNRLSLGESRGGDYNEAPNYLGAFGKYQFIPTTWQEEVNRLHLTGDPRLGTHEGGDKSPHNQEMAANDLALRRYPGNLEKDLADAHGNIQKLVQIASKLAKTWTSLPGGAEPNSMTPSFGPDLAKSLNDGSLADRPGGNNLPGSANMVHVSVSAADGLKVAATSKGSIFAGPIKQVRTMPFTA